MSDELKELVDEMHQCVLDKLETTVNSNLDRAKIGQSLVMAFGQLRKTAVSNQVMTRRLDQIGAMAKRLKIKMDLEKGPTLTIDDQDQSIYIALKFGSPWHESLDVDRLVLDCLLG